MWYKVKKIYVGTQKIRPYWYEYSYDFRWKTWSQCQSDWWTLIGWYTPSISSDGIYYNWWDSFFWKQIANFTNAKKITFSVYYNCSNSFDWFWPRIQIVPWESTYSWLWIWKNKYEVQLNEATTKTVTRTHWTWWFTQNMVYDLVNKTYTYTWDIAESWTLTDAQVTSIKSTNWIWLILSSVTVQSVNLTVE